MSKTKNTNSVRDGAYPVSSVNGRSPSNPGKFFTIVVPDTTIAKNPRGTSNRSNPRAFIVYGDVATFVLRFIRREEEMCGTKRWYIMQIRKGYDFALT